MKVPTLPTLKRARVKASAWRKRETKVRSTLKSAPKTEFETTGYVIIHRGKACGWVASLEDSASGWVPGCLAVPPDSGPIHIGVGGNDYDGAKRWVRLDEPTANVSR